MVILRTQGTHPKVSLRGFLTAWPLCSRTWDMDQYMGLHLLRTVARGCTPHKFAPRYMWQGPQLPKCGWFSQSVHPTQTKKTPPKSLREDGTCRNWTGNHGTKTMKSFASHLWSGHVVTDLLGVDTFTGISAGSVLFGEPLETLRGTLTHLTGRGPSQDQAPHIIAAPPATVEPRHSTVGPAGFLLEIDY